MPEEQRASILDGMPTDDAAPAPAEVGEVDELARKLATITRAAEGLRKAGVTRVAVGGDAFELLPWMPPAPERKGGEDDGPRGPLHDPALYPGGVVPRLEPPPPRARPKSEEFYDGDES